MYNKETEPCSAEAKCDFRSFRAVESFWTKQQSFISKNVGHQKWCPFFDFVCFNGRHFNQLNFAKKFLVMKKWYRKILSNFDFVCFSGCHFTKGGLFQKLVGKLSFLFQKSSTYIIIIHISKVFCQFNFFYCILGFSALWIGSILENVQNFVSCVFSIQPKRLIFRGSVSMGSVGSQKH